MFLVVAQTGQTKHPLSFYENWRFPQVLFHVWKGRMRWGVFSCNMQLQHFMSLNSTHCNFERFDGFCLWLWMSTWSCCLTRWRSQDEVFFRITLRMGCQSSEISEPSVTEARTLTFRPLPLWLGTPLTYKDCFPASLREFRYTLHKDKTASQKLT